MHWSFLVWILVGMVCAIRVPILHFTLVVIAGVCVYAVVFQSSYVSAGQLLVWCLIYGALLQFGYVCTHCIFYLTYIRTAVKERRSSSQKSVRILP